MREGVEGWFFTILLPKDGGEIADFLKAPEMNRTDISALNRVPVTSSSRIRRRS